ncbi:MAG TPA: RNA polymerase sigma factor [Gammaproteobacteria bacterium]|nr:RNA polymerase sigma factor [Gammaproteobacteria bacterium]MDP7660250.1 RNA polymerase sigma factor [Gammaproteobacteria bacterium]HJP39303.1 RNA polymerase sigma factor [Gammaproteobacteria bacterium]
MDAEKKLQQRIFARLLRPYLEKLYRQAYWLTRNRQDAEDIVQDVLIKLYPRCEDLLNIEKLEPWLARILHRTFIDNYRQKQRRSMYVVASSDPESLELRNLGQSGSEHDSSAALLDIQAGLLQLNEDQRFVILMHDVEGYTLVELENILDIPLGTLKSRLHRGRRELRKFLAGEGTFC